MVFSITFDHFQLHVIQKHKQIYVGPFTLALVFLIVFVYVKITSRIFFS